MPRVWRSGCLVLGGLILALALVAVFGWRLLLDRVAEYLVFSDTPVRSDAIVAVSGDEWRRRLALDLYGQGLAPRLVFNVSDTTFYFGRAIDPVASVLEEAAGRGVPPDSILVNRDIPSTWEDARASLRTAEKYGLHSLIVVSSPFYMRRTAITYRHVFRDSGVELCFVSVPPEVDRVSLERWWTRERELEKVNNEYLKLVLYYFKYFRHDSRSVKP